VILDQLVLQVKLGLLVTLDPQEQQETLVQQEILGPQERTAQFLDQREILVLQVQQVRGIITIQRHQLAQILVMRGLILIQAEFLFIMMDTGLRRARRQSVQPVQQA
jgi:hypothetical protein